VKRLPWPEILINSISDEIRVRREELGLTIYALSQLSGVSQQGISYYERGTRRPTLEGLAKVAKGLSLELSELIARAERRCK
jgi:transcriptional regulator with XRE-family HTH domain